MKFIKTTTLAFLFLSLTHLVPAQQYPSKPVRIIVPFPAAGAVDATTRILGERLSARWGHPVIVDNRPGAAGNIYAGLRFQQAGKVKFLDQGLTPVGNSTAGMAAFVARRRRAGRR